MKNLVIAVLLVFSGSCLAFGDGIIFQSASPPASQLPAVVVANSSFAQQAEGVLFQITQTTLIDSIGVWVYHNNNTAPEGLFGEIFSMPDLTSLPPTDPYSSSGLGRAYFPASDSGQPGDLIAPLPLTLIPGYYALIIGTLPSSEWEIPLNGADASGIGAANFIGYFGSGSFLTPQPPKWQPGPDGMSLLINGEVTSVPEAPSALLVLAFLPLVTFLRLHLHRGSVS
jgi:hypothetical protein